MIITEILKEKQHLVKICLDDGESFLIDKSICFEEALSVGDFVDCERIKQLKYNSEYSRAKSRALWYLDRSDYTEKALYSKLLRAGFQKKACAAVLARFIELGLIDDERYAHRYAERCMEANVSTREALHKMLEKGVPYDLAKEVLKETETDEKESIKALIEKKYAYKLGMPEGNKKVFAALARKGFSYSDIRQVLAEYVTDDEVCGEY